MAKLGDVFPLVRNGASIKQTDGAAGIPITRIETISNREIDRNKFGYANIIDGSKYKDYILQDGDILMSHINSEKHLGKVALYRKQGNEQIIHGMNLVMLRANPSVAFPPYATYFFETPAFLTQIKKITKKSVNQASFTVTALKEVGILLPPLDEQRRIAAVLDKVSGLIAKRREQLDKLDELVKARFVEMFGEPSTNPYGWLETTIGKECYYIKDGPHKSLQEADNGQGYPFISVRNIVNGFIDFSTAKYISEKDYLDSIKKCYPQKGDILYSKGGTTGIAKLIDIDVKFANWVHLAVLKFDSSLNGVFFENMLNSDYCYKQSQRLTKGIANKDLVLSAMAQIKLYKPPLGLQEQFANFVGQTNKSKLTIQQSLDKLEVLKKALMQQYFG